MLNRRHLRIKVLQALYTFYQSEDADTRKVEKALFDAIDRIYDLYIYLMLTLPQLKYQAERRVEENKKKIRPAEEDLNPNLKFINNQLTSFIEENEKLNSLSKELKINWLGDEKQELFRKMFLEIRESESYFEHMNNEHVDFEAGKNFASDLFKEEIANFSLLYDFFEEKSIHWLDDIDLACSMVLKTFKEASEKDGIEPMNLYKEPEEEKHFIQELFRQTIVLDAENEKLIDELTKNWELDRIAKMDVILMKMAVTELQIFETIPTKVTLNEYIEISKFYSTPKSKGFINGVVDKAIVQLKKENKINKEGRGLKN